jgi:mono/diheme cytochrome c family protein
MPSAPELEPAFSMRSFLSGVAVTLVAIVLLAWVCVAGGYAPINADAAPPAVEQWAARTAVIAGVERQLVHGANPAAGEPATLDGIRVYKANCEVCHGASKGEPGAIARGLYQRPPQFAKQGVEDIPYAFTAWIVRHGIRLTGMPAFSPTLTGRQIDDLALFLQHMNKLTPAERFAWGGEPLRTPLVGLYRAIGGSRACTYLPKPRVAPHHFRALTAVTTDGQFLVEHFYNRGISEISVLGFDAAHHRFVRTKLSKDGTVDIAVSPGFASGAWAWTDITGSSRPRTVTTIAPQTDGSYAFRATNDPGIGSCGASF